MAYSLTRRFLVVDNTFLLKVNKVKGYVEQVPEHDNWRKQRLTTKVSELEKMEAALQTESGTLSLRFCGC